MTTSKWMTAAICLSGELNINTHRKETTMLKEKYLPQVRNSSDLNTKYWTCYTTLRPLKWKYQKKKNTDGNLNAICVLLSEKDVIKASSNYVCKSVGSISDL